MSAVDDLKAMVQAYRDRGEPHPPETIVDCPMCGKPARCRTIPGPLGTARVIGCSCASKGGLWVKQ